MEVTNYTYPLFIEPCLHIAAGVGSVPSAAAAATATTSVTTAASVAWAVPSISTHTTTTSNVEVLELNCKWQYWLSK